MARDPEVARKWSERALSAEDARDEAVKEADFWKRRAGRLRYALLDIAGGCNNPREIAGNAIEAERDARETGK